MMEEQQSCLAELSVSGRHLHWSKEIFAINFNAAYKLISEADHVRVGAIELFPELYGGRRWLHWETSAGRVCLREVWLDKDLVDHTICLQLGGSHLGSPSSVHLECISAQEGEENNAVRACFVMADGSVHNLMLESEDEDHSFLAHIVDIKEGGLVESVDSDSSLASKHSLLRTHQLSDSSLNNQTITSTCFLSHFAIVFGLSDGDVVYLRVASGSEGVFVETVMRYTGVVQALWSGLMGSSPVGLKPKVVVLSGSHLRDSSIALAYTADGCLSVWDCLSRVCLQKVSVLELLQLGGEGRGGVSVESVKLDTCPIDNEDTCCLGIVLAVSTRSGRERMWNNVVMSWSPTAPRTLLQRGRLAAPKFNTKSLLSTKVQLEQISLSPCGAGSRSGHGDTIASLWKVDSEVIPVAYYLPRDKFCWMPPSRGSDRVHTIPARFVSLGPAEKHAQWREGDQVFDQAVISSFSTGIHDPNHSKVFRWSAMGTPIEPPVAPAGSAFNVEIDMHYLRTTFLQRLFSAGRFPYHVIVRVITQDVPYDVQQLCSEDEDGGYEGLMDLLFVRGMDTDVDEMEDDMVGFARGNLGGSNGSFSNGNEAFISHVVDTPMEILVKAVIDVCGKYEELVLDRLVSESDEGNGILSHESKLSAKLKRYRKQPPNLSLRAQVEVFQHVLQLCEDRLCQLRSGANTCSLLVHSRGSSNVNVHKSVVETPFEFVVVRPSGLGVVVSTSLVVESRKEVIPDYSKDQEYGVNDISSYVPFKFSTTEELSYKQRLIESVGVEMAQRPQEFALLDTLMSRFVADVSYYDLNQDPCNEDIEVECVTTTDNLLRAVQFLFTSAVDMPNLFLGEFSNIMSSDIDSVCLLFEELLRMPTISFDSADKAGNFSPSRNPMCSFSGAELLNDLSALTTRSAYEYYVAVACVFLALQEMCQPEHEDVNAILRNKYLPKSLRIVAHYAFVHWTESVHLSASRQLEKQVDVRDLTYNSLTIKTIKKYLSGYSTFDTLPFDSSVSDGIPSNTSVMLSFWHQFSTRLTFNINSRTNNFWGALGQRCLFAMRPSSHGDFTSFLLDMGQHCLATKCSSLALLSDVQSISGVDDNIVEYFFEMHSLAMQRMSGLQMFLHDITSAVLGRQSSTSAHRSHSGSEVTLDTSNMEEIKKAINLLIGLVDQPCSFSDRFLDNEWSCHADSQITPSYLKENLMSSGDIKSAVSGWTRSCQEQDFEADELVFARQEREEGLLCLSEALTKLADAPYFRVFYTAVYAMIDEKAQSTNTECPLDVTTVILQSYPDIFMELHSVSLAMNCHNLVNRSRTLFPLHFGVEMALNSGYTAVAVLERVISNFTTMFNAWHLGSSDVSGCRLTDSIIHYIRKELEIVLSSLYSSILDLSLLSCRFDEGYNAVINLIVLCHESAARDTFFSSTGIYSCEDSEGFVGEHMDTGDDEDSEVMGLKWHGYLRSLVVKACSCGQLKWVCDRPDVLRLPIRGLEYREESEESEERLVVETEDEKMVDVVEEISNQFEFVCMSSDFTDYFSGNDVIDAGSDSNSLHLLALYDCWTAFLLSKNLRQECARVLYQLVCRLDDEFVTGTTDDDDDFDPLRILEPQSRALGVAVGALHHDDVKLSQRHITFRDPQSGGGNKLLHVTLADMEHRYLQVQSKISLYKAVVSSGGVIAAQNLSDEGVVRGMCSQGNFFDAINLGISSANHSGKECPEATSSIGRSPCLEQAISLLAEACSTDACPPSLDTIFQFTSSLGSNLTSFLEYEETGDSEKFLREYLVHCLQCLDGSTGNWALHAAATESVLKSSPTDALGSILKDSYSGFTTSNESDFVYTPSSNGLSGNISAFLLQLLKRGYLSEACDTATRMLNGLNPRAGHQDFIPYSVLDRIMDACTQVLTTHDGKKSSQIEELERSHKLLEEALSYYFRKLLVVEAGAGM